ncbi:MAG TPA: ribosome biogenesis GTPase Der [bacterium]|nr:ribosome biogenesis GTPase Der [bacterium]HQM53068.1 ribosome biogenesis GTPase Der [bacterium]
MRTVALAGRPNVGKSALFNRLAGKRIAIVDSTYGMTRDRICATAEWGGRRFTVVDTGGIDFDSSDTLRGMARRQAQLAIEQADTVLFVADAIEGLVPLDREIAALLRAAGKRVIVAVNKADNEASAAAAGEFHRLGFPDVFPVSATHGRGMDALLDALVETLVEDEEEEVRETLRVAVLGRPNVGKSSWVNAVLREERMIVDGVPGTTRDAVDTRASWRGKVLTLIDTAGIRREGKLREAADYYSLTRTRASLKRCDAALMLLDALEGVTVQDEKLARSILDEGRGCVLGVNKWDLVRGGDTRRYRETLWGRMRFFNHVPVVFLSAKLGRGIGRSLDALFLVREQTERRVGTPVLNRILHQAWERTPPASLKGKRCRLYYAAQTGVRPPAFSLFVNNRDLLADQYAQYLSSTLRRAFGFEGAPLRLKFKNRR